MFWAFEKVHVRKSKEGKIELNERMRESNNNDDGDDDETKKKQQLVKL